ncbi:MAG TPA: GntP family permease [Pedobacter sp.]|uniref:GntP family permease n=1 Tax=Pedobacter sp. TaxID=1411316 RepID=UPI002C024F4B|nr:GntP family permease [Pedobacter sp.]HMI02848.1 GntP family permease [Pedobacter sp.]
MELSFIYTLLCLLVSIAVMIVLSAKYRVHAFFALMISCFIMGLGVQLSLTDIVGAIQSGFGNIMKSLGLIVILGTTLGVLLEYTGATKVMAAVILRKVGESNAAVSMSVTGFIVGLPIFCDSGYIVLSSLSKTLSGRTGISMVVMAVSLATGLYAVHCLIPPHPGAAGAAAVIGADFGKLMLIGTLIAIPAGIVGHLWAVYAGKKYPLSVVPEETASEEKTILPSAWRSFLPVIVPILLIGLNSFYKMEHAETKGWLALLLSLGNPSIALAIGVILAFNCKRDWTKESVSVLLRDGAEKAGSILVIIGAGGAFGAVLTLTHIGDQFSRALPLSAMGILFPFLITSMLKTAQGSSTVAIITAASIVHPLLIPLGLNDDTGRLLCVLCMGAGSMMISHANDAYFWVIAKFSGLEMRPMLNVYSVASLWMGLVSFAMVYLLSLIL